MSVKYNVPEEDDIKEEDDLEVHLVHVSDEDDEKFKDMFETMF
jgi:hypothetical protein